ncbi:hypothetical protein [Paraburkholderia diazotrophica]|uniref:Uncharacterized protein n=1 Tax=Paraburkholderia diazotrophica TaxID=667676 RepID=A0A1H6SCS5_9BURK|nr:hypothetical protein [Paraburkholderia diazotrophica]SEI63704.1 hypothetical protein SAMN05192539_100395 [Paraburkholderia diazotrophica]
MNLDDEMRDLRQADDAISAAQSRIGRQFELLQALDRDGHNTGQAEKLLAEMQKALQVMIQYRATIAAAIDSIKAKKL